MCRECWSKVPREMQAEVNRTVVLRNKRSVDATWAPWWRAQAAATHYVACETDRAAGRGLDPRAAKYLQRENGFADQLERGK